MASGGEDDRRGKRKMTELRDSLLLGMGVGGQLVVAVVQRLEVTHETGGGGSDDLGGGELRVGWPHHPSWCSPTYPTSP